MSFIEGYMNKEAEPGLVNRSKSEPGDLRSYMLRKLDLKQKQKSKNLNDVVNQVNQRPEVTSKPRKI